METETDHVMPGKAVHQLSLANREELCNTRLLIVQIYRCVTDKHNRFITDYDLRITLAHLWRELREYIKK